MKLEEFVYKVFGDEGLGLATRLLRDPYNRSIVLREYKRFSTADGGYEPKSIDELLC